MDEAGAPLLLDLVTVLDCGAEVWRLGLDPSPSALHGCWADLSDAERARAARLARPEIRRRFIAAHAGLRRILSRTVSRSPRTIEIVVGAGGKPALPAGPQFNLSHSGDLALCVVAPSGAVGVDVEQIRPIPEADELARRWLGPAGRHDRGPEHEAPPGLCFLRRWTVREAFLKARGVGLGGLPATEEIDQGRWSVHELRPAAGYVAAVVVERKAARPART